MPILGANKSIITQPRTKVDIVGDLGTEVLSDIPGPEDLIHPLAPCPTTWASQSYPGTHQIGRLRARFNGVFEKPLFVIGGGDGAGAEIGWSPNGINFQVGTTAMTGFVWGVVYAPDQDLWVAVGTTSANIGQVETSGDGKTFTSRSAATTQAHKDVDYGAEWFCAALENSSYVARSQDGITWSLSNILEVTARTYTAICSNGMGEWLVSYNGVIWKSVNHGLDFSFASNMVGGMSLIREIMWDPVNCQWIACGNNETIATSSDGVTWVQRNFNGIGTTAYRLSMGNGCYLCVGFNGFGVKSTDTITWTPITTGITGNAGGVAFGFNEIIVTSDTQIRRSEP